MDRSWYQEISVLRLEDDVDDVTNLRRMNDINTFERQLADNGYLILKFFLHISQKEQRERLENLANSKNTEWRVTQQDWKRNKQYDRYYRVFDEMLEYTNTTYAPWHVVARTDRLHAELEDLPHGDRWDSNGVGSETTPQEAPRYPGEYHSSRQFYICPHAEAKGCLS